MQTETIDPKLPAIYQLMPLRRLDGFAAMGHELDSDITPIEPGMAMMASRNKTFVRSEAVNQRRAAGQRSLVTMVFDDDSATPLGHEPIYCGDEIIGHTTSESFGYRIGRPVALAHAHCDALDGCASRSK